MTETGDGGAAGRIENPPAILGNQPDSFATDGLRGRFTQTSM
jgi:hypothetical protein